MSIMLSLEQIINNSNSVSDVVDVPETYMKHLKLIGEYSQKRKAVYTVLTTLLYYKHLHPKQDIRKHQAQIANGFSGRSFDTAHVTPILKKCELPAMAESGWLTRSME